MLIGSVVAFSLLVLSWIVLPGGQATREGQAVGRTAAGVND